MISHKLFMIHPLDNWFFKCVLWPPLAHMKTQRKHGGNKLWSCLSEPLLKVVRKAKSTQNNSEERKGKWKRDCLVQLGAREEMELKEDATWCSCRSSCSRALLANCHQWSSRSPTTAFNGSGKIHHTCFFTVCVYVLVRVCVCMCVFCHCFLQPSSVWRAESIWPSAAVGPN